MIKKAENKSNFTILSNAVLLDETISDKARGTLVRLLARPENWNLNINHLVKTGKDGNTAIRSAVRELEDAGYIQRDVTRHENGRIVGVEYIIHESPVNSCGDRPAPEQRASSCKGTVLPERPDNEDAEPELITLGDPEPEPSTMAIQAKKAHIEDANIAENHMSKTVIKQTAPIINTDIKQILRVTTTTTCAREAEPVICDQVLSLPSSSPTHEIINLIPSQHRNPVVLSLVSKAIVDYPEREVKEAIAYAGANVRGGSMQYKAYLDKTLKNKWADGFLDAMQEPGAYGAGAWFHPRAKYPNGTVTGNKAMDTNYMVAAEFLMEMGVDANQMCAEALIMEKQDIKAFTDIMLAIADNYPGATFTSAGLKLRFEALKDFSIDQVSGAAVKLIRDHKYNTMPTTADIIDAMGGSISVNDRAEIEAGKVIDHLRKYGKGIIPEFEDPVTQYLMTTRWRYCSWAAYVAESELKWWFKDFVRAYRSHTAGMDMGTCLTPGLTLLAGQIGNWEDESLRLKFAPLEVAHAI